MSRAISGKKNRSNTDYYRMKGVMANEGLKRARNRDKDRRIAVDNAVHETQSMEETSNAQKCKGLEKSE